MTNVESAKPHFLGPLGIERAGCQRIEQETGSSTEPQNFVVLETGIGWYRYGWT